MDQTNYQLDHQILELATQLDLHLLLVIDAPFHTFALPHKACSIVLS